MLTKCLWGGIQAEEKELLTHKDEMWKQQVVKEGQFKLVNEFVITGKKGGEVPLEPSLNAVYKGIFHLENPDDIKPPKNYKPARQGQVGSSVCWAHWFAGLSGGWWGKVGVAARSVCLVRVSL